MNDLYANCCEECGGFVEDLSLGDDNWDDIYLQIASELLSNQDVKINADLHLKTAQKLIDAVNKGLATTNILDDEKGNLVKYLQQNIYHFSAAKSFTQMQYYRDMMIGEDGAIVGKGSFIKKIADTGEIFNRSHLETEYENAHYSSIMAHKWETLNADFIEYSTVGDRNVRPEHAALNKFTAPKDHAVWKKIYPPNGWNCRCTVVPGLEQNSEKKITAGEADALLKPSLKDTPFENNVGLSKVIFKENHPYFVNANGKEVNLSWQQYGLPNLDKIETFEDYSEQWMNAKGVITEIDFSADPKKIDKQRKGILVNR